MPDEINKNDDLLKYANDFTGLVLTTMTIVFVNHPIGAIGRVVVRNGQDLPSNIGFGGWLNLLYRGCFKNANLSFIKVAAKENHSSLSERVLDKESNSFNRTDEQALPETGQYQYKISSLQTLGLVSGSAAGAEALVLNGFKNQSALTNLRLGGTHYNWKKPYNIYKINSMCISSQFGVSLVNIIALCQGENWVLSKFTFSENMKLNHFFAGAICGLGAYTVGSPLEFYHTIRINQVTVDANGRLVMPSLRQVVSTGFTRQIVSTLVEEIKHSPIKSIQTAATFGIFALGHKLFSEHPPVTSLLQKASFFIQKNQSTNPNLASSTIPDPGFDPTDWTFNKK